MVQGTSDVTESRKVGDAELVTVGIDVSDRYSHLCVLGGEGEIVREERVSHHDRGAHAGARRDDGWCWRWGRGPRG